MTFDLTIFDSKETLEKYIQSLIEKRSQIKDTRNPKFTIEDMAKTTERLKQKNLLTQQIYRLSEISELDYD